MSKRSAVHGAGFAAGRANAIAELSAGILSGRQAQVDAAVRTLDAEQRAGNSPCGGRKLHDRVKPLLLRSFPSARGAEPLPMGAAGDLKVVARDGVEHHVEIKAQLEKPTATDLTQADWVRNQTDALRFLCARDDEFRSSLSVENRVELQSDPDEFDGWSFGVLWLSDVAGLTCGGARLRYGVRKPADIEGFLQRKHLLHMCAASDRLVRLDGLPTIQRALANPGSVRHELKFNSTSECAVPVSVGLGPVVFTYHIYPHGYVAGQPFVGRHKLHGRVL
jgi:hypothetical protein